MRTFALLPFALVVAVLATPAGASTPVTLHVTPSSAPAGGAVEVTGSCESNTHGFAISHAFLLDSTHDFAGVGAVPFTTNAAGAFSVTADIPGSVAPGTYDVSARCGGGNLGVTVTLTVTPASGTPTAVPAGSGGQAASSGASTELGRFLLAGLGLLLLLGGGAEFARRRATP